VWGTGTLGPGEFAWNRFMPRTILHVDMHAFYTSVEQRDHPEYIGKPVIVGADPKGGMGRARDRLESRFGKGSVARASLLEETSLHPLAPSGTDDSRE
jgi:hypothetical protein